MPGFTSRADLVAHALTNGKIDRLDFTKGSPSPEGVGIWHSCWTGAGRPAAGANPAGTPGIAYTSDQSTPVTGSIWFPNRSTDLRFLTSLTVGGISAQGPFTVLLYDRLAGVGGISCANGSPTVNSVALPRYSGTAADKNEVWMEVSGVTATAAPIAGVQSYTSSDGTSGLNASGILTTFPAVATNAGTIIRVPLRADAAPGVRSVETVSFTGGGSGTVNVLIVRPLAYMACLGIASNQTINKVSFVDDYPTMPRIFDGATLGLIYLAPGTNALTLQGSIETVYG